MLDHVTPCYSSILVGPIILQMPVLNLPNPDFWGVFTDGMRRSLEWLNDIKWDALPLDRHWKKTKIFAPPGLKFWPITLWIHPDT
jgi:hypothetical protein